MAKELIGIIGGTGKMGQAFKRFFEERGHQVAVAGRKTELTPIQLSQKADIVIISVPIDATIETIREIAPHLRSDSLFMDFTSLKEAPLNAMLESFSGAVLGAHPVFGPSNVISGETVVFCPGRGDEWQQRAREIFQDFRLVEMEASEHDQAMALIQGLQHFLETAYAATMAEIGIPLAKLLEVASPVYRIQMDLVGRIIGHDADLYAEIVHGTAHSRAAVHRFTEICRQLADGDANRFIQEFNKGKAFFGDFSAEAQQRSDEMIFRLSDKDAEALAHPPLPADKNAIGVLGPAFTWSDLAAGTFFPDAPRQLYPSFAAIFSALESDEINSAFLPIENKIGGAIRSVWEEIAVNELWIVKAFDFPVAHVLAAREFGEIKTIYGHEQSLSQCRKFLEKHYPSAALISTASNSQAVRRASLAGTAAICSKAAAESLGFTILASDIADRKDNITRFALVRKQSANEKCEGERVTSITFELKNESGSLLSVLRILAEKNINMVRLESVPTGRKFSEYAFYLDFEGGMSSELHEILTEKTIGLTILGHYSVYSLSLK